MRWSFQCATWARPYQFVLHIVLISIVWQLTKLLKPRPARLLRVVLCRSLCTWTRRTARALRSAEPCTCKLSLTSCLCLLWETCWWSRTRRQSRPTRLKPNSQMKRQGRDSRWLLHLGSGLKSPNKFSCKGASTRRKGPFPGSHRQHQLLSEKTTGVNWHSGGLYQCMKQPYRYPHISFDGDDR